MSLQSTREFVLKEKTGSIWDKVWVMDTDKEQLGYFKGKSNKIGDTYRLYDLDDKSLLTAYKKIASLSSTYNFYKGGEQDDDKLIGKMKRKIISVKPNYWFEDLEEKKVFTMMGNDFTLKYKIFKYGEGIAEIRKKVYKKLYKSSYSINIVDNATDNDAMLILGMVIMLNRKKEENR